MDPQAGSQPAPSRRLAVITRPAAQAAGLRAALAALDIELRAIPVIRVEPPADRAPLARAARELQSYDWLVLTSAHAVAALAAARRPPWPAALRVAAVGRATAGALEQLGQAVTLVPAREDAGGLVAELSGRVRGRRVLFPRSSIARRTLPEGLRAAGAVVEEVEAYRTVEDPAGARRLAAALRSGACRLAVVTSPSAARALAAACGGALAAGIGAARLVSIGPATSAALRELGRPPDAEAPRPGAAGLVEAVRACYKERLSRPDDPPRSRLR